MIEAAPAMGPIEAREALLRLAERHGQASLRLAMHAAMPQTLRPELLHLLKINFVPGHATDVAIEADVLFAPFVDDLGSGYFRLDPEARRQLMRNLPRAYPGEARVRRLAAFLLAYLERRAGSGIDAGSDVLWHDWAKVERWVAIGFLDPDRVAEHLAGLLAAHAERGDPERVAARFRLGAVTEALELPLGHHQDLLAYAAAVEAAHTGRTARAASLVTSLGDRPLAVGDVELAPATTLLETEPAAAEAEAVTDDDEPATGDEDTATDGEETEPAASAPAPDREVVFISHSWADKRYEEIVRSLIEVFEHHGIETQLVLKDLRAGIDKTEIEQAIASSNRFLLIVERIEISPWVDVELDLASRHCKPIVVARFEPELPLPRLPEGVPVVDLERRVRKETVSDLVAALRQPVPAVGPLYGVREPIPDRPPDEDAVWQAKALLLAEAREAGRKPIGLIGDKRSGKTPTLIALARDCEVRRAFPAGVFWLDSRRFADDRDAFLSLAEALGDADARSKSVSDLRRAVARTLRAKRAPASIVLDSIPERTRLRGAYAYLAKIATLLFATRYPDAAHEAIGEFDRIDIRSAREREAERADGEERRALEALRAVDDPEKRRQGLAAAGALDLERTSSITFEITWEHADDAAARTAEKTLGAIGFRAKAQEWRWYREKGDPAISRFLKASTLHHSEENREWAIEIARTLADLEPPIPVARHEGPMELDFTYWDIDETRMALFLLEPPRLEIRFPRGWDSGTYHDDHEKAERVVERLFSTLGLEIGIEPYEPPYDYEESVFEYPPALEAWARTIERRLPGDDGFSVYHAQPAKDARTDRPTITFRIGATPP